MLKIIKMLVFSITTTTTAINALDFNLNCSKHMNSCVKAFAIVESNDGKYRPKSLYTGTFRGVFQISEVVFNEMGTTGKKVLHSRKREYKFMKTRIKYLMKEINSNKLGFLYMAHQQGITGLKHLLMIYHWRGKLSDEQRLGVIKRTKSNVPGYVTKGINWTVVNRRRVIKRYVKYWKKKLSKIKGVIK